MVGGGGGVVGEGGVLEGGGGREGRGGGEGEGGGGGKGGGGGGVMARLGLLRGPRLKPLPATPPTPSGGAWQHVVEGGVGCGGGQKERV